ncbi:CidA/LrgA family protein [Shouchella patagoniensis]|uniref:CidA/LrgA family protein n=1 Tax=Shouchella patagoniensis TaxID=228576 RepID=UPI000994A464|nr:CidA/LrgA family holin-like protein [Shouchella patagoniensis]
MTRFLRILTQVAGLYLFHLLGTGLTFWLNIPISGSLIGMILLFMLLWLKILPEAWLQEGANVLLAFLPVFFVPITAGIMNEPSLFTLQGLLLILVTFTSTCVLIVVSGHIGQYLAKQKEGAVKRDDNNFISRSDR